MSKKASYVKTYLILFAAIALLTGCGGGGGGGSGDTTTSSYTVSWDTNRESGVNSTGGGYRVYHSTTAGFDIGSADVVDVPHASGTTPTSTTLTLSTGIHYIKVVAYSALNPTGSTPSSQIAVTAP